MPSKVYFTRTLTPEKVVELYKALGISLPGKVAVKLHSGEEGNQNFLGPDFWKPMIEAVSGTVVECNTAYEGSRNTTKKHLATLEKHGWSKHFHVDLLDAQGPDMVLDIPDGHKIHKNYHQKPAVGGIRQVYCLKLLYQLLYFTLQPGKNQVSVLIQQGALFQVRNHSDIQHLQQCHDRGKPHTVDHNVEAQAAKKIHRIPAVV